MDEDIIGVIYALPLQVVRNILNNKKKVFVKNIPFTPTKRSKVQLKPGMKIFFYESGGSKLVHGYAIVKKIEFLSKEEIIGKYKSELMISKKELNVYCIDRKERPLMVIVLENHKLFANPTMVKESINMGGRYLTKNNWKDIFSITGDING